MKYFLLLILCLLSTATLWGQGGYYPSGGRAAGLSDATLTLADSYAFFHNPAALSQLESLSVMAGYRFRPGWEGMEVASLAAAGRWRGLGWGLGAWRFGDALYSEQWVGLAVGYQMGLAALGLKVSWLQYHIDGFGARHLPLLEVGGWAALSEQWQVGGYVSNLLLSTLSATTGERVPTVMRVGVAYLPLSQLRLVGELHQPLPGRLRATLAVEYEIIPQLWLRAGAQPTHQHFSGGLGYQWHTWRVAYATQVLHPAGLSHQLSILRQWPAAR